MRRRELWEGEDGNHEAAPAGCGGRGADASDCLHFRVPVRNTSRVVYGGLHNVLGASRICHMVLTAGGSLASLDED